MYIPPAFAEDRPEELHAIMQAASLPVLVSTIIDAPNTTRMIATHLPLTLHGDTLIGHFAKANEHWKNFNENAESLAIFTAVDGYISPSWYAAKQEHGKVVPTWNYEAVHVYGRLEIITAPQDILSIVTKLTKRYEEPRAHPWHVSDAPDDYIAAQLKGIVGVVLNISRIEGKRKLNQNRATADREGVIAGLADGNPQLAAAMLKTLQ
ncbi:MAG: FMN-binding negative transcriptional regulator [Acidocella sp.]|nr:FMN-binding negative transcriptional regulator [Acidocella sp.]